MNQDYFNILKDIADSLLKFSRVLPSFLEEENQKLIGNKLEIFDLERYVILWCTTHYIDLNDNLDTIYDGFNRMGIFRNNRNSVYFIKMTKLLHELREEMSKSRPKIGVCGVTKSGKTTCFEKFFSSSFHGC